MSAEPIEVGEDLAWLAERIEDARNGVRYPLVRTGERAPVPSMLRTLVWLRDGGRCAECSDDRRQLMELDHVVPWSAGGPDVATNLRVMCRPCNERRSNFVDFIPPRPCLQVTPMCDWCVDRHDRAGGFRTKKRHTLLAGKDPIGCPVCRGTVRIDEWDPPERAWCGSCGHLALVTGPGRLL